MIKHQEAVRVSYFFSFRLLFSESFLPDARFPRSRRSRAATARLCLPAASLTATMIEVDITSVDANGLPSVALPAHVRWPVSSLPSTTTVPKGCPGISHRAGMPGIQSRETFCCNPRRRLCLERCRYFGRSPCSGSQMRIARYSAPAPCEKHRRNKGESHQTCRSSIE